MKYLTLICILLYSYPAIAQNQQIIGIRTGIGTTATHSNNISALYTELYAATSKNKWQYSLNAGHASFQAHKSYSWYSIVGGGGYTIENSTTHFFDFSLRAERKIGKKPGRLNHYAGISLGLFYLHHKNIMTTFSGDYTIPEESIIIEKHVFPTVSAGYQIFYELTNHIGINFMLQPKLMIEDATLSYFSPFITSTVGISCKL